MISEFHELLDPEQVRDQRFEPDEPTAEPQELPTAP
jgi:hypothetical protein